MCLMYESINRLLSQIAFPSTINTNFQIWPKMKFQFYRVRNGKLYYCHHQWTFIDDNNDDERSLKQKKKKELAIRKLCLMPIHHTALCVCVCVYVY